MIEDNLKSMAELARENGVRPILASVLPAAVYLWKPEIHPIDKILTLNQWMKEYAAKEGIVYLDYYSSLVNDQHGMKAESVATVFIRTRQDIASWLLLWRMQLPSPNHSHQRNHRRLSPESNFYLWLLWLFRPNRWRSRGFIIDVHSA
jgi:hypothetical protein